MPANPGRRHIDAEDGSRFLSSVVAENVRAARRIRNLNQEAVAARMRQLGHATWSRAAVSEAERGNRSITLDELLSLAVVLDAPLLDLLDPTGPEGRNTDPIDYGGKTMPAVVVREWTRGRIRVSFSTPGSFFVSAVPGHEDVLAEVEQAIDEHHRAKTAQRAQRLAAAEQSKTKKGKT